LASEEVLTLILLSSDCIQAGPVQPYLGYYQAHMGFFVIAMIFLAFALGFVFLCLAIWGIWLLYRFIQKRKQQRAHRLATYLRRLRPVIGQLLHQANELDQASKYSGLDRDAKWAKKYGEALNKLLEANTKLEETNVALVEQELALAQDCLLYVIRTIHVVSYRLREMEPVEERIELMAELKMEQARAANASEGGTSSSSNAPAASEGKHSIPFDVHGKADEHQVLKVPEKKQEILRDDSKKN